MQTLSLCEMSNEGLATVDNSGTVRLWETGVANLERSLEEWRRMLGASGEQLTIERDKIKVIDGWRALSSKDAASCHAPSFSTRNPRGPSTVRLTLTTLHTLAVGLGPEVPAEPTQPAWEAWEDRIGEEK